MINTVFNVRKLLLITVLMIILTSFSVFAIVGHPAAQVFPGLFASGDYTFDGNVGIGTTNPEARLEVDMGPSTNNGILLSTTDNGFIRTPLNITNTNAWGTNTALISVSSITGTQFVVKGNGNVGIGTTNPGQKLHVSGGNILIDNSQYYRAKNNAGIAYIVAGLDGSNNLLLGTDVQGEARIAAGGTTRLTISTTGNVGIGTTSPAATLDVNGSIAIPIDQHLSLGGKPFVRLDYPANDIYFGTGTGGNYYFYGNVMSGFGNIIAGNVRVITASGSGNAYACFDTSGNLYRSASACVP